MMQQVLLNYFKKHYTEIVVSAYANISVCFTKSCKLIIPSDDI